MSRSFYHRLCKPWIPFFLITIRRAYDSSFRVVLRPWNSVRKEERLLCSGNDTIPDMRQRFLEIEQSFRVTLIDLLALCFAYRKAVDHLDGLSDISRPLLRIKGTV